MALNHIAYCHKKYISLSIQLENFVCLCAGRRLGAFDVSWVVTATKSFLIFYLNWNDKVCDFYFIYPSLDFFFMLNIVFGGMVHFHWNDFGDRNNNICGKNVQYSATFEYVRHRRTKWKFMYLGTLLKMREYLMKISHNMCHNILQWIR